MYALHAGVDSEIKWGITASTWVIVYHSVL